MFIPIKCPFTNQIICDGISYYEPFPKTVICTNFCGDITYYEERYEIANEIIVSCNELFYESSSKKIKNEIIRKINREIQWLKLKGDAELYELFKHPLIKQEFDQNEYDNPGADGFSVYFALPENHQKIIDDFTLLHKSIKTQIEELLLFKAYLKTDFVVFDEALTIKVGKKNSKLTKLLIKYQVQSWAYITAWNPFSNVLSDKENAQRHQQLIELTKEYKTFEGEGRGDDPKWNPERSLLVLGISRDEALRIGNHFEQNAIVFGEGHKIAELLFGAGI